MPPAGCSWLLAHQWFAGPLLWLSSSVRGVSFCSVAGADERLGEYRLRNLQWTQHGAFLGLMRLHPSQNVVECADRLPDVRAFVQHHTLGPFGHCRIGDLCA